MTLFSLIVALVLEQWQPLNRDNRIVDLFRRYADVVEHHFNAGERHYGAIAWMVAVVPVLLVAGGVYYFLRGVNPLLAWAWNVVMLYLTMGFRQFSHAFTEINEALRTGDLQKARGLLAEWLGQRADEFNASEISRVAIEQGLLYSHRYVFGVIACFVILPGPVGAVLYRLASILSERWGGKQEQEFGAFGNFAAKAFEVVNWLPARLTALSFAIVGDFEDAVYCWRAQAMSWAHYAQGIILASGAGALGVRLGEPLHQSGGVFYRPELGVGEEADVDFLQSAVGLIWRTMVLWLVLLLLLTVANWAG